MTAPISAVRRVDAVHYWGGLSAAARVAEAPAAVEVPGPRAEVAAMVGDCVLPVAGTARWQGAVPGNWLDRAHCCYARPGHVLRLPGPEGAARNRDGRYCLLPRGISAVDVSRVCTTDGARHDSSGPEHPAVCHASPDLARLAVVDRDHPARCAGRRWARVHDNHAVYRVSRMFPACD